MNNNRYIDKDSFTETFGMSTIRNRDLVAVSRTIANLALNNLGRFTSEIQEQSNSISIKVRPIMLERLPDSYNSYDVV